MPPNWQITTLFVLLFIACFIPMKLANTLLSTYPKKTRLNYFLISPFLSIRTWINCRPATASDIKHLLLHTLIIIILLYLTYTQYTSLIQSFSHNPIFRGFRGFRGYLALPAFLILIHAVSLLSQWLLLPCLGYTPHFLNKPHTSKNISNFWTRHWNSWHGPWFHETTIQRLPKNPNLATTLAFTISAIWHEILITIPLYLTFNQSVLGLPAAYFLIQIPPTIFSRKYLKQKPRTAYILQWLFIVAPLPLMLNNSTLLIFHFITPP